MGQGILGTSAPPWQSASGQSIQLALSLASGAWAAETQPLMVGLVFLFLIEKCSLHHQLFPGQGLETISRWEIILGKRNRKLEAILPPAPTEMSLPQPWNFPEVGRAGLNAGEKPGWTVETACLACLSCGQATWASLNGLGCCSWGLPTRARDSFYILIPRIYP